MIVDNATVLTGSLNWSSTSELKTLENLIVLNRPAINDSYTIQLTDDNCEPFTGRKLLDLIEVLLRSL